MHLISLSLTGGVRCAHGQAEVLHWQLEVGDLFMPTKAGRSTRCMQTQGPAF
jgi:hypothetical protein